MNQRSYISASEVGDFVYCKRGWWLRSRGLLGTTSQMLQGMVAHESLLHQLLRIKFLQKLLLIAGLIILLSVLLVLLFI